MTTTDVNAIGSTAGAIAGFVEFVFASILFGCVASVLQASSAAQGESRRIAFKELADSSSRILISISASLYYYLIFKVKIIPDFSTAAMQWMALVLAISAAVCGGFYLFLRIEYFALGTLLLISSACCYWGAKYSVKSADFLSDRALWHFIVGMAAIGVGLMTKARPRLMSGFLRVAELPVTYPSLRVGLMVWIYFMIRGFFE